MQLKEPKTYEEQLGILKGRGCIITDDKKCMQRLSLVNYYRLTAYFIPFKDTNGSYKEGTDFENVYNLYEFDRKLRYVLLSALECVEISLRTRLSYLHAHKYGALGYLNRENFNSKHKARKFQDIINEAVKRSESLPFIKHHKEKYDGKLPIWVVSELFTFGVSSTFYSDLFAKDQKEIAKQYKVNYSRLRGYFRCLTDLRNICAHCGRLYARTFSAFPAGLGISEVARNRLWGAVMTLKAIYPEYEKWKKEVIPALKSLFKEYGEYIDLKHMAFPEDWLEILQRNPS